ncbi:MAG: hypothetical protein NVSMB32_12110 [Actinomycetota bacterium]
MSLGSHDFYSKTGVNMDGIMAMLEQLMAKFFGGSAMPVIRSVIAQIIEVVASLFKRFSPASA